MITGELLSGQAAKENIAAGFEMRQGKLSCGFAGLFPEAWISL